MAKRKGEGTRFAIDRKLFSSDVWRASPWKLKIWIYLIGQANHHENDFMGISIKRGQLIRSYRTIAKDCAYKIGYRLKKPSVSTIRRICEELTKEGRIEQQTTHTGTLITIINYEDMQVPLKGKRNSERNTQSNSRRTVGEHNNNDLNNDLNNEKNKPSCEAYRLSRLLWGLITERQPDRRRPDFEKWAEDIDLLLRGTKGKRPMSPKDPEEVEEVIEWVQDNSFWQNNILSPAKLRKQYDNLRLRMEEL